jgi:hypothetical protein
MAETVDHLAARVVAVVPKAALVVLGACKAVLVQQVELGKEVAVPLLGQAAKVVKVILVLEMVLGQRVERPMEAKPVTGIPLMAMPVAVVVEQVTQEAVAVLVLQVEMQVLEAVVVDQTT